MCKLGNKESKELIKYYSQNNDKINTGLFENLVKETTIPEPIILNGI